MNDMRSAKDQIRSGVEQTLRALERETGMLVGDILVHAHAEQGVTRVTGIDSTLYLGDEGAISDIRQARQRHEEALTALLDDAVREISTHTGCPVDVIDVELGRVNAVGGASDLVVRDVTITLGQPA